MAQILPHLPMSPWITFTDNAVRLIGKGAAVVKRGLDEGLVALTEAVNVAPGGSSDKGEFVGGGSDDGAILVVEAEEMVGLAAGEEPIAVGDVTPRSEEGARESVEGVADMGAVDDGGEGEEDLEWYELFGEATER